MAGILSKGIKLSYQAAGGSSFTDLTNLQEIPDLGGDIDTVEVTTLADAAHMYINGLKDYGDSLDFVFLYEATQFNTLTGLTGAQEWKVTLPDNTTCTFSGEPNVKLDGVGTNEAMTYTLSVTPQTEMVFAAASNG